MVVELSQPVSAYQYILLFLIVKIKDDVALIRVITPLLKRGRFLDVWKD